jgi:hypothetical protein
MVDYPSDSDGEGEGPGPVVGWALPAVGCTHFHTSTNFHGICCMAAWLHGCMGGWVGEGNGRWSGVRGSAGGLHARGSCMGNPKP